MRQLDSKGVSFTYIYISLSISLSLSYIGILIPKPTNPWKQKILATTL